MAYSITSAEECRVDRRILDAILQQPMAENWERLDNYNPYVLVTLAPSSQEYKTVAWQFQISSRLQLTITKIQRVENPFLLGQYLMKKEKMRNMGLSVQEKSLYHGTQRLKIDGICKRNFDWRRCGQSRGHKFGKGVSFALEASYARHYTQGDNVMFLTKVLVRNSTIGNLLTTVPPEGFDTTVNSKGSVYVKYEDDDFYPEYLIYYTHGRSSLHDIFML